MEDIRIIDLLNHFFNRKWIIFLSGFLCFLLGYLYVNYYQVPMYHGTTTIIIVKSDNDNQNISQSELAAKEKLVSTYSEIIKSRKVLEQVIAELALDVSVEELKQQISVSSVDDTAILKITITDKSNKTAAIIADSVALIFKQEIVSIYNIENISIVDNAIVETSPYNVKPMKYYVIFIGIGVVLSCLYLFVEFYFDNTVKTKKEVENLLGIPVLCEVSFIKMKDKRTSKAISRVLKNGNEVVSEENAYTVVEPVKEQVKGIKSSDKKKENVTKKKTSTKKTETKSSTKTGAKKTSTKKTTLVKKNKIVSKEGDSK